MDRSSLHINRICRAKALSLQTRLQSGQGQHQQQVTPEVLQDLTSLSKHRSRQLHPSPETAAGQTCSKALNHPYLDERNGRSLSLPSQVDSPQKYDTAGLCCEDLRRPLRQNKEAYSTLCVLRNHRPSSHGRHFPEPVWGKVQLAGFHHAA